MDPLEIKKKILHRIEQTRSEQQLANVLSQPFTSKKVSQRVLPVPANTTVSAVNSSGFDEAMQGQAPPQVREMDNVFVMSIKEKQSSVSQAEEQSMGTKDKREEEPHIITANPSKYSTNRQPKPLPSKVKKDNLLLPRMKTVDASNYRTVPQPQAHRPKLLSDNENPKLLMPPTITRNCLTRLPSPRNALYGALTHPAKMINLDKYEHRSQKSMRNCHIVKIGIGEVESEKLKQAQQELKNSKKKKADSKPEL